MERNYNLSYDSHIKNTRVCKCPMFISSCNKIDKRK